MKKIGLISLALVLALGAMGVAYAAWTDTVIIEQTVRTGSLQIGVYGEAELVGDYKNIASAEVSHGEKRFEKNGDEFYDSVTVAVGNWYPCVAVAERFVIGIGGSIPMYLDAAFDLDDEDGLFDVMTINWTIQVLRNGEWVRSEDGYGTANAVFPYIEAFLGCFQHYPCDEVYLSVYKHLPQSETQNRYAEFTLTVTGTQYNKVDKENVEPLGKGSAMASGEKYPSHSWFMYVAYEPDNGTDTTLVTGAKLHPVGTVTFAPEDEGNVTITINLDPGYSFVAGETKVSVKGYTNEQDAIDEGNWPFCTWPYAGHVDPAETTFSFEVPAYSGDDPYLFYAVHVNVGFL